MASNSFQVPVVTIDGPAASGKTSVSRGVASRFGWKWVSTGAFYRTVAFVARMKGLDLEDEAAVLRVVESSEWLVRLGEERTRAYFQETEVTEQIYLEDVGAAASQISHHPRVRAGLLEAQRGCTEGVPGLVAEGRDCGTVIFPDATVKIYLTAKGESRAQRRVKEQGGDLGKTYESQRERDHRDQSRKTAPLQIPPEAHILDTSDLTLDDVVQTVYSLVSDKLSAKS